MAERMVYIGHKGLGDFEGLRIGQTVHIRLIPDAIVICPHHGPQLPVEIIEHPTFPWLGWCPLAFRKPINFKSLCNVPESIKTPTKETEDA